MFSAKVKIITLFCLATCCIILVLLTLMSLRMAAGVLHRYKITNKTGNALIITSGHTNESKNIQNNQTTFLSHGSGGLNVTFANGKCFKYGDLTSNDLTNAQYGEKKQYSFITFVDGYLISSTGQKDC
jgi:hypothetical protein